MWVQISKKTMIYYKYSNTRGAYIGSLIKFALFANYSTKLQRLESSVELLITIFENLKYVKDEQKLYHYIDNIWKELSFNDFSTLVGSYCYNNDYKFTESICKQLYFLAKTSEVFQIKTWPSVSARGFKNIAFNVMENKFENHKPELYLKYLSPIEIKQTNISLDLFPNINKWLNFISKNDAKVKDVLMSFIRIALTKNKTQYYLELVGPGGTGKSTFANLLIALVGNENYASTELNLMEHNRFETSNFYGKPLIVITDAHRYTGDVSVLRKLLGGDPVRMEEKFKAAFKFLFTGLILVNSNEDIHSSDYTTGLIRRRIAWDLDQKPELKENLIDLTDNSGLFITELSNFATYLLKNKDLENISKDPLGYSENLKKFQDIKTIRVNSIANFIDNHVINLFNSNFPTNPAKSSIDKFNGILEYISINTAYEDFANTNRFEKFSTTKFNTKFIDLMKNIFKFTFKYERSNSTYYYKDLALKFIIDDLNYLVIYLGLNFKDVYFLKYKPEELEIIKTKFFNLKTTNSKEFNKEFKEFIVPQQNIKIKE